MTHNTRTEPEYPHVCRDCGVPVTEWDDEYGYVWDERGFATCGETDTAHYLAADPADSARTAAP